MVSNSALRAWPSVGMKCICIDASTDAVGMNRLTKGAEYTVSVVGPGYIRLEEVHLNHPERYESGMFRTSRFRPLVTKTQKQDVAAFRTLLTNIPSDTKLNVLAELLNQ